MKRFKKYIYSTQFHVVSLWMFHQNQIFLRNRMKRFKKYIHSSMFHVVSLWMFLVNCWLYTENLMSFLLQQPININFIGGTLQYFVIWDFENFCFKAIKTFSPHFSQSVEKFDVFPCWLLVFYWTFNEFLAATAQKH
jgi:hypothetical protein